MMEKEAKKENFMQAAVRDELFKFKKLLLEKFDDLNLISCYNQQQVLMHLL
jgi:hypothetical protein